MKTRPPSRLRVRRSLLEFVWRRQPAPLHRGLFVESLEERRVLSTINWVNRGDASDNFDALFGAGAPAQAARAVVDAAIDAWERVVVDFNHAEGVTSPSGFDLDLTISMNLGNNGCGASTSTTIGADGKPTAGSQSFGSCGANGSGWFIDPTPNDHSEFAGTIINAFTGTAQAGSPAAGLSDFYSIVLAELTHNMGICNSGCGSARYNDGSFWTDTGTADDTPAVGGGPGNFFVFQGPTINALMTNNNGGSGGSAVTNPLHTAEPRAGNASIAFGGVTVFGADDNGNCCGGGSTRTLVSNRTALILKDSYDYDIVMPETFGSMYAILNETTGLLTIRGGADNTQINGVNQGPSSDNITIVRDGDQIVVSVDIGVDVPGTGTGKSANDAQDAFVTVFPYGQVASLNITAGDGDDFIFVAAEVGIPVTIDPGNGNDRVYTGSGPTTVTSVAGDGDDLIDFGNNPLGVNFTVNGADRILGTAFNDVLTVNTTGGLVAGTIFFDGRGGHDRVTVEGDGSFTSESLFIGATPGSGRHTLDAQTIEFFNIEPFTTIAPAATFTIGSTAALASLLDANNAITYTASQIIDAGGRVTVDDFEPIEFRFKTNLVINAGSGSDTVEVNNALRPASLLTITVNSEGGNDNLTFLAVPDASATAFVSVTASGGAGNDVLDARAIAVNTPFLLNGQEGDDVLIGGRGNDVLSGGSGNDLLIGGDPSQSPDIGSNGYDGGSGMDTIAILGTPGNDTMHVFQDTAGTLFSRVNGNQANENFENVEEIRVEPKAGLDLIRIVLADNLVAPPVFRYHVVGGGANGSDRLLVRDDGPGDLVLVRQMPDERSGRISIAPGAISPLPEIFYEGINRIDIDGQNPVTGGTGSDGMGRVVVFQPDPFELNDNRLIATDIEDLFVTHRDPNIDPGGIPHAFGPGDGVQGDEDWYQFRAAKVGTFRLDVLFDEIGPLLNGRAGLPASGNLDVALYDADGNLIVLGTPIPGGEAVTFSTAAGGTYYLRIRGNPFSDISAAINTYDVRLSEVDLLGPQVFDPDGAGPLGAVHITDDPATIRDESLFDLFDPKPSAGPTPLVKSITIHFRDLVSPEELLGRAPGDIYTALDPLVAATPGLYRVVGDANGVIPIEEIIVVNTTVIVSGTVDDAAALANQFNGDAALSNQDDFYNGQILQFTSGALAGQARIITDYIGATRTFVFDTPFSAPPANGDAFDILPLATAAVELHFSQPLPDDRFTLTVLDSVRDLAGNRLDGESNAIEPHENPHFPSGDGFSGGNFVARFTVDTRAELGSWAAGSIYIDTNGNFLFDPTNIDYTNRDITYVLGFTSDNVFAGNFVTAPAGIADGFDKLGVYGKVGTKFRWLIDTDNDGVPDINVVQPLVAGLKSVSGLPAAGNFDGSETNGDEVVLKVGNVWLIDTNHDFIVDTKLPGTNMTGLPIVGDFDGDGIDDLGAWADNTFRLNLSTLGPIDGATDVLFTFGFPSTRERPVAADFDGDGIDDIGLWVPDRAGAAPSEMAEWYLLYSGGRTITQRLADGGGAIQFTPYPFGEDRFAQFGDQFGLPVVGNFDPPVVPGNLPTGTNTNPQNALDVNNDGFITPLDALLLINHMGQSADNSQPLPIPLVSQVPFLDTSGDGYCTPLDVLLIVNWLNANPFSGGGGGSTEEGEGEFAAATDAYFDDLSSDPSGLDLVLTDLALERTRRK